MGLMGDLKKGLKGTAEKLNEKIEKTLEAVDDDLDLISKLKAEEKGKMEQLGPEAYIEGLKTNAEVYGQVSGKTMDKVDGIYAKIADLKENHPKRLFGEGTIYGLGVHYRRKMIKNEKNIGGE